MITPPLDTRGPVCGSEEEEKGVTAIQVLFRRSKFY